ncbi:MAG: tetratricopeptide repeat protein [Deltaproteobacteria bacterium]|nr:tetratricopeptide repeat protein [Deltaproteobacteria bacterium]
MLFVWGVAPCAMVRGDSPRTVGQPGTPSGTAPSPGQPDPVAVAQARSLFEQGLAAADRRDWATAVDLFTRSLAVRSSPSVAFNLGLALVQLGRRAEARVHLVHARDRTSDPSVRERARTEIGALERTLGRVEVRLASPLGTAELRLDGHAMVPPPAGSLFVDAGGHVLAVVRDGREVDWAAVEVQPGRTVVVSLDPTRAAPPPRDDTAVSTGIQRDLAGDGDGDDDVYVVRRRGRREPRRSRSVLEQWWFWTAVGVVVAGATTATLVAVSSSSEDPYRGNLGTFEIP